MDYTAVSLVLLVAICVNQVSGRGVPTADEKIMGSAIANKLNQLMRPTVSLSSWMGMSAGGRVSGPQIVQKKYLDFQLLLDSSGSIGSSNFDKAKEATNAIVDVVDGKSPIRPDGSRVSLIEFSSPTLTKLVFGLRRYPYARDVKKEIERVKYDQGSSTATALALSKAKTEFEQNPSRYNVKVVWIVTDGQSNTGGNPVVPANELKRMGVTVCAAAIGNNINMNEINAIASSGCVFNTTSFASYARIMDYVLKSGGDGDFPPILVSNLFHAFK